MKKIILALILVPLATTTFARGHSGGSHSSHSHSYSSHSSSRSYSNHSKHYSHKSHTSRKETCWRTNTHTGAKFRIC